MKITETTVRKLAAEFKALYNVECAFIAVDSTHEIELKDEGFDKNVNLQFYSTIIDSLPRAVVLREGLDNEALVSNALPPVMVRNLPLNDDERLYYGTL